MSGESYTFFIFQVAALGMLGYIGTTLTQILKELKASRYEQRIHHAEGPQAPSEKKSKDPDWMNDPNVRRN